MDHRLPSIGSAAEGPLLVATKPELREYKAISGRAFSAQVVVNCDFDLYSIHPHRLCECAIGGDVPHLQPHPLHAFQS